MAEKTDKDTNEFITRDDFIDWVLHPTTASDSYWKKFIHDNPSSKADIEEALFIIKNLSPKERLMDDIKKKELWNAISEKTIEKNNSRKIHIWSVAASVVAIVAISVILYLSGITEDEKSYFSSVEVIDKNSNEVRLIFSDNTVETLNGNDLDIKYDENGQVEITTGRGIESTGMPTNPPNEKKKIRENKQAPGISKSNKLAMNQLIVPRGKRTTLTLSDGTRLYLNSGSKAIFPAKFSDKKREIYIEGEAFIEVAHDPQRPFIASANEMQIRVLGTKFNVSAYPEDPYCSVVLVEGKIAAEVNSQQIAVEPDYLLTYHKNSKETSLNRTEVMSHISWIDGWLYCDKQELGAIAAKLSRYYNVDIKFMDDKAPGLLLSGKLDLKTECADIFKAISAITSISFEIVGDEIIVSEKE